MRRATLVTVDVPLRCDAVSLAARLAPPAATVSRAYVPAARLRHRRGDVHGLRDRWWRTCPAPTSSWSVSSTTIPTPIGSERAVLEGLARRRVAVTLSLEMFERDVQDVDRHLSVGVHQPRRVPEGGAALAALRDRLPAARRIGARRKHWPVVAANVPRRFAAEMAKRGKPGVDALSAADRRWSATDLQCPHDAYFDRFAEPMSDHSPASTSGPRPPPTSQRATTERYYWAQCSQGRDDGGVDRAGAREAGAGRPGAVVHVTGAFHSDFGAGTARARPPPAGGADAWRSCRWCRSSNLDTLAPRRRRSEAGGISGLYDQVVSS